MNIALFIGKKNSRGVPGKNIMNFLGRPSCEYSFLAAKYSKIDKLYISTDSDDMKKMGERYNAFFIERPEKLAQSDTLTEDVLYHAYQYIKDDLGNIEIDTITLFFCNTPAIDIKLLNEAIDTVTTNKEIDSCFSVAKYDMFSPARARKINDNGIIEPFVDLKHIEGVSSLRDTQASSYFTDFSIQVMNPRCFDDIYNGPLPFKWQGHKSQAIITDYGFDIDAPWQIPVIEKWLINRGFTETTIPWK